MSTATAADRAVISLTLGIGLERFLPIRAKFVRDIAAALEVDSSEIRILSATRGCTNLTLELPANKMHIVKAFFQREPDLSEPDRLRYEELANVFRKYELLIFRDRVPTIVTASKTGNRTHPEAPITWLHLSDVHFEAPQSGTKRDHWTQDVVKQTFVRDIADLLQTEQLDPDIVFITGDVAFSGDPREYQIASEFIQRLRERLPRAETPVMLIPGNHDVSRRVVQRFAREEKGAARFLTSNKAVIEYLRAAGHERAKKRVFQRLNNFFQFAEECKPFGQPASNGDGAFAVMKAINGYKVGIAGLNSAWRCSSDKDRGRVVLGVPQVEDAAKSLQKADIRIVLVHHPPGTDWFVFEDMQYQRNAFTFFDFILRGHEHDPKIDLSFFAGRKYCEVSSGALYSNDKFQQSINAVQIDPATQAAWVFFWKLAPGALRWVKDVELYRNGFRLFQLPERLGRHLASGEDE